ncbi:MAG: hypothetical protein JW940_00940 [Polyangiaceae bacterium]|nr:hypothetical protein [Polyangiaceae bacterium]
MGDYVEPPIAGKVPYTIGQASIVRIPVPGSNGLCIESRPRGPVLKSGSTSSLFIQDPIGKRHLRLDYGFNPTTKTIDYHWNQKRVYSVFGITNHATVDSPLLHIGRPNTFGMRDGSCS